MDAWTVMEDKKTCNARALVCDDNSFDEAPLSVYASLGTISVEPHHVPVHTVGLDLPWSL